MGSDGRECDADSLWYCICQGDVRDATVDVFGVISVPNVLHRWMEPLKRVQINACAPTPESLRSVDGGQKE